MADTAGGHPPALNGNSKAANGSAAARQPTYYHSLFSDLVSWKKPRDSVIAYVSIIVAIIATHYLPIVRWAFKLSWMTLAVTIAAEVAGKTLINTGLASQFRPRQYFTVSQHNVEALVADIHELLNFFAIEAQRIFFVESVGASSAACFAAFVTYYLIKIVPYWGLAVLGTTMAFFAPLVYSKNQELIDQQLKNASDALNAQTAQVRKTAQKQADHLAAVGKQYAGNYTVKVQDLLRGRTNAPPAKANKVPEFPSPPTEEPKAAEPSVPTEEPIASS